MGEALGAEAVRAWMVAFVGAFRSRRAELDELDRRSGDGDFGSNLLSAIESVERTLEAAPDAAVSEIFAALASAFMDAGGTSGPLFGVWFREFARASTGAGGLDTEALAGASAKGLAAVARLGGAGVGDKTMVDAMSPVAESLAAAAAASRELGAALAAAAAAAREGAEGTAQLIARRGRASYVGEVSRGVPDPGAEAVAMFFEAASGLGARRPLDA